VGPRIEGANTLGSDHLRAAALDGLASVSDGDP